ncbi:GSCOCG00012352001-RA-CDS [Cotesia congregata]|uniref:Outer dynein arm-docking complex subunit 4 n=1 Tax=Cotesia congregata TaxID=51543 RepID=A0A8J2HHL1_COTCN|nr:GSCOCG00012352001-RA-CDS [Cotesia congregata]CAG5096877.1 Similar to Odad4: Outer dynein arm-docking complex subunit 4 (Mus musculus) [Cotesia congregata]
MSKSSESNVTIQVSNILKPTLQDNDFLQSFVRIGLDEGLGDTKKKLDVTEQTRKESKEYISDNRASSSELQDSVVSKKKSEENKKDMKPSRRFNKGSVEYEINEQKTNKVRRRKTSISRRQEEVYTDKDRAAAVNMGTRDIIQSLKIKRRQDRSKMMQIPEEAEPSAMLALGTREMRSGNLSIAISCINKALELSPSDKNALLARSKCYLLLGEPQKALHDAEAALNEKMNDSNNARAIFYKAESLYHLGDFELSLVFYYRGMRIRPEFDQFRLGVQKAKEAIQNILDHCAPIKIDSQMERRGFKKPKFHNLFTKTSEMDEKIKQANGEKTIQHQNNSSTELFEKCKNSSAIKRESSNLLGQLNVDKKYLQELIKRPGIITRVQIFRTFL